jgi:hypothetical protein
MSDLSDSREFFDFTGEPTRRGSSEKDNRLDSKGNFHRAVEVTNEVTARKNARRGK